jgi:stringent starvation protein B
MAFDPAEPPPEPTPPEPEKDDGKAKVSHLKVVK